MTANIETNIWKALKKNINLPYTTYWPLDSFKLDVLKEQLIVTIIPNIAERFAMGNDAFHDYNGILQISLLSPLNRTQEQVTQICGNIVNTLPESLVAESEGVRVYIAKRGDIGQTYRDEGMWRTPVSFRYRAMV